MFNFTTETNYTNLFTVSVSTLLTATAVYSLIHLMSKKDYEVLSIIRNFVFFATIYYLGFMYLTLFLESTGFTMFQPTVEVMPYKGVTRFFTSITISTGYILLKGLNPLNILKSACIGSIVMMASPLWGGLFMATGIGISDFSNLGAEGSSTPSTGSNSMDNDTDNVKKPRNNAEIAASTGSGALGGAGAAQTSRIFGVKKVPTTFGALVGGLLGYTKAIVKGWEDDHNREIRMNGKIKMDAINRDRLVDDLQGKWRADNAELLRLQKEENAVQFEKFQQENAAQFEKFQQAIKNPGNSTILNDPTVKNANWTETPRPVASSPFERGDNNTSFLDMLF